MALKVKYQMEIIETSIFTKRITEILKDDEYKELQSFLCQHPKSGDVIRNIYYFFEEENSILMVYVYKKSETEDLTPKQINALKKAFL